MEVEVRALTAADGEWADAFVRERWGSATVVSRGRMWRPADLPGFMAVADGGPVGLATYRLEGSDCELVTIDSVVEGAGVGTALLAAIRAEGRAAGCTRLWLITTNDNLRALGFYQRRGFVLARLHRDAIEDSRRLKPEIALVGQDGIPIRDELELELRL